jgi:aryl-alcohol dehydrogenase-like predicted oxidoreductase
MNRVRDDRLRNIVPRFSAENRKTNQALVDLIDKFAQRKKATPAQIALAGKLKQPLSVSFEVIDIQDFEAFIRYQIF